MIKLVSGILYIFSKMWQVKHFVLYYIDVILHNKVYCLPPKYPAAIKYLCYKCLITVFAGALWKIYVYWPISQYLKFPIVPYTKCHSDSINKCVRKTFLKSNAVHYHYHLIQLKDHVGNCGFITNMFMRKKENTSSEALTKNLMTENILHIHIYQHTPHLPYFWVVSFNFKITYFTWVFPFSAPLHFLSKTVIWIIWLLGTLQIQIIQCL